MAAHSGRHEKNKFSGEERDDSEMEGEDETSSEEDDESPVIRDYAHPKICAMPPVKVSHCCRRKLTLLI